MHNSARCGILLNIEKAYHQQDAQEQRVIDMKGRFIAALKKIAVILIASIMVLGIVPVGVLTLRPHTANAEGEFLRFSPVEEASVMRAAEEGEYLKNRNEHLLMVGGKSHTYLQFDLQSLIGQKETAPIRQATLRLTAVRTGIEKPLPVRIWMMPSSNWNSGMTYQNRPSSVGEIKLAELTVDPAEAEVVELDITAYLRKWVEEETQKVSLHLDAGGDGIAAIFAATAHEDSLYRPCLKVVTGDAFDPDSMDITKAWLDKTAQVGGGGTGDFYVGKGADTYLEFHLKPENIRGAMYQVNLELTAMHTDPDAKIEIYQLKNGEWNQDQWLPRGEEVLIDTVDVSPYRQRYKIDLSHPVNDAYAGGETQLTLRISGSEDGRVIFSNREGEQPRLRVWVSDAGDKTAVTEAILDALEDNTAEGVTHNLSASYTTENGNSAQLRWTAKDAADGTDAKDVLNERGEISRPKWFEDSRVIQAVATVSAGEYTKKREYLLTVLPEEMPDKKQQNLDNMVNLGQSADEDDHGFAFRNADVSSRWIGTKHFPYRTLQKDGLMAMALAVDPQQQNYVTLKIWKKEKPTFPLLIENMENRNQEPLVITAIEELAAEDGFLYLTYPLPMEQTRGREYVTLRLRSIEETVEAEEEPVRWNLYGIYTGQSLYFDPMTFAEQGETFAGKKTQGVSVFKRLLKRIYMAAKEPWEDFREQWRQEDAATAEEDVLPTEEEVLNEDLPVERFVWMDSQPPMLAFDDSSDRIAITLWEKNRTQIHRSTLNYDTYAEGVAKEYAEGLTAIDYYKYRIFRNVFGRERYVPNEEGMEGIYQDLITGECYSFLQEGQTADESALPEGVTLKDGSELRIPGKSTVVLKLLAEPLSSTAWRISEINNRSVARLNLNRRLTVSQVTVLNTGQMPPGTKELQVLCCVYEKGMICGISRQTFTTSPEIFEYVVHLPEITVEPGQSLKLFVEETERLGEMTPKLNLP